MRKILSVLSICLIFAFTFCINVQNVSAEGGINSNEARIVAVAKGGFSYNNELYIAKQTYVDQLIAYLSQSDINLTEEQANKAVNAIYSNIEKGVKEGYIVRQKSLEDDLDRDMTIKVTEISPEEQAQGVTKPADENAPAPTDNPGRVIYEESGKANIYNSDGNMVVSLDGVLKNTGYNYAPLYIGTAVIGLLFSVIIAFSAIHVIKGRKV